MKKIGLIRGECIKRLNSYLSEMEKIKSLFKDKSVFSGADKKKAKELLKSFKEKHQAEVRLRDTVRGKNQMSDVERAYYWSAINGAYAKHIKRIKLNSIPSQEWTSELYGAKIEFEDYLDGLNKKV